jgi:archaeosortase A (PGF-CTERM-specific)
MNEPKIATKVLPILMFFLLPTVMLLVGFVLFPFPPLLLATRLSYIPLFIGLVLLGVGFLWKKKDTGSSVKSVGWVLFAAFWSTMPSFLYLSEDGDIFNAVVCVIGVYVLVYLAYHEWLSRKKSDYPIALNWIAGATFLAGIIYFSFEIGVPGLKNWFIDVVAAQSTDLLHLFGVNATRVGSVVVFNNVPISIIFACTAIQSMVLFIGMIGAIASAKPRRKALGLFTTVIPIYFLNLIRNAGVVYMVGSGLVPFDIAHNVIGKIGSLLALILLLFITFKIVPELYDEILGIIDLPRRRGPLEDFIARLLGKKHDAHR